MFDIDKKILNVIIAGRDIIISKIIQTNTDNTRIRRVGQEIFQREAICWKCLNRNCLKTNLE